MTGPLPRAGSRLGHYLVERQIGAGGMGAVFLARDLRLQRPVALKVLLGHHAQSPKFLQRFQREASVLARLDSPHVISIYDHGEVEGWPYIVTQYAAGGDLGALIRERGPLPPGLAARVCSQVADALAAAHRVGVIHRDVKPANVLIRDASLDRLDRMHVYLADFGVAHTESTGLTTAGALAGTWNYLAPERAEGAPGSPATDVYSVGCLLWETLTGAPPYSGSDVEVAMAHLHAPVPQLPEVDPFAQRANPVLARALAKDPTERPETAIRLRDEIRALAPPAVAPSFSGRPALGRSRSRLRVVGALTLGLVLAGGAAAAALWLPDRSASPDDPGPTVAPTPTDPAPVPEEPVSGDLDGDRRGDVAWVDDNLGLARSWTSTGSGFRAAQGRTRIDGDALVGDVTGDGRDELVDLRGSAPVRAAAVFTGGRRAIVSPVSVPQERYDDAAALGDFDGDGFDDLAVASYGAGRVEITVATGSDDGGGTFDASTLWYRTGDISGDHVGLAVGDVDADGRDDLVMLAYVGRSPQLRLLSSTTTKFRAHAADTPAPALDGESGYLRVVDLEGDGAAEIVFVARYTFDQTVRVWGYADGGFEPRRRRDAGALDALDAVDGVSVSDVDGDGAEDLVLWLDTDTRARVLVTSVADGAFTTPRGWLSGLRLGEYGYAVGRVSDSYWYGYS